MHVIDRHVGEERFFALQIKVEFRLLPRVHHLDAGLDEDEVEDEIRALYEEGLPPGVEEIIEVTDQDETAVLRIALNFEDHPNTTVDVLYGAGSFDFASLVNPTGDPITIDAGASIREAAHLMSERNVSSVMLTENDELIAEWRHGSRATATLFRDPPGNAMLQSACLARTH